jgi:hypothetical protein
MTVQVRIDRTVQSRYAGSTVVAPTFCNQQAIKSAPESSRRATIMAGNHVVEPVSDAAATRGKLGKHRECCTWCGEAFQNIRRRHKLVFEMPANVEHGINVRRLF